MNESEWMTCTDPRRMLQFLLGTDDTPWMDESRWQKRPSVRKLRLFANAAIQLRFCYIHRQEKTEDCTDSVEVAEHLMACVKDYGNRRYVLPVVALLRCLFGNPWRLIIPQYGPSPLLEIQRTGAYRQPVAVVLDEWLSWNGGTVRRMAEQIDAQQSWDDLPILADMLEEAGCPAEESCPVQVNGPHYQAGYLSPGSLSWGVISPNPDWKCATCDGTGLVPNPLLAHLRSPGPHARGCHVLDVLLDRE